jgi:serine/threonine protein kinase
MQPAAQEISTCPGCGSALEETSGGGLGCMVCLLRVGIGDDDPAGAGQDSNPNAFGGDERFGVYEIERREDGSLYELGCGAMGITYRAIDTSLQRKVALKIIKTGIAGRSAEARGRFMREARTAAALRHENIATVFQFGIREETGQCFYAMELIEGETLDERVRRAGPLDVRSTINIAEQVTAALAAAEKHGLVHRDLKPANLMLVNAEEPEVVGRDRRARRAVPIVKIIDFGLAKALNAPVDPMSLTRGGFVGTPAFASPEQFDPENIRGALDVRSDIYSLGVTLWFALTGKTPFGGRSVEEIRRTRQSDALPIEQLKAARAPSRLRLLLESMLAFEPAARPGTQELAVRLRRCSAQANPEGLPGIRLALAGTILLILSVSAFFVLPSLRIQNSASHLAPPEKSIAVLPFENLSTDEENVYFVDEITESLINSLSRVRQLRVIAPSIMFSYKGRPMDARAVGRELNVDAVLTGSVVRSGERVRIAVQLIHATTNRNLWADSYERNLRDVLALQREVAQDIVGEIRIKLTPQEQAQFGDARPVNPEAYDHYLRGRFYLHRQNQADNETAIAALERAVATDRTFAAAYAELAQAYVWKLFLFAPGDGQLAEKAFVAAEKALSLDPNLAVAYLARGRILWTPANHFPHEKAIREYRRALILNPNLDEARNQLALVYCHIGAFDEALQESQKAITSNPNNNLAQFRIGQTLNFQGKYEQALSVLRALPPEVNPALIGHQIAWALFNLGRKEEASSLLEQLLRDHPEDNGGLFASVQAILAASAGQQRMAEDKIKSAVERGEGFGHFHHTAYHIACAYALMNKPEQAIKWLEVAAEDGFPCYPLFERDTNLDNLRQDARFVTFLTMLRQQWELYRTIL